jgi:glutathione S-transferase
MTTKHQLIGAEVSYYTAKVRAYLRYKQIPYDEVTASREVYQQVIVPRTGVRFIPVLISDDDVAVQDSSAIIDFLEQRYPEPSITPEGPTQRWVARLFELYGDEWLVLPAMHYRWSLPENRAFAVKEFGRLSAPNASEAEQQAIGEKLSGPFAGALPALGVHPATIAAIEQSYQAFLHELDAHLAHHPFLLGALPSIGDFALFGPLYAHLYRDPASGRLMKQLAPRVVDWVERMRSPKSQPAQFLAQDAIPSTIEPLLARMFRELGPVLERTIARLMAFESSASAPLPRSLGTDHFELAGATATRAIYPFNVWRWQRAYDEYQRLSADERRAADALADRIGARRLLQVPLTRRLRRIENRLAFADAQP